MTGNVTYRHCSDEVRLSLLETEELGDNDRSEIGDDCLHNEDDRDHCEIGQLLCGQLRCKFREDCMEW